MGWVEGRAIFLKVDASFKPGAVHLVLAAPAEHLPEGILGSLFLGVFSSILAIGYYFFDCNMIEWENKRKERKAREAGEEQSKQDD